ncbi:MAG: 2,3-bisphosphoglycerate-independent phosphoglycerate mutase [Chloroflexota bacterium]|nr:2,3-bisphosphoglycerate-independent phosphoglycerate mutase [Chloroflexota bacterium]
MIDFEHIKKLSHTSSSKIVLLVIDGVGGLPHPKTGKTELESARTPNLDQMARESICGLSDPISPGITPGSAPGHLAIFGYDPITYNVGRGILEALGIGLTPKRGDIAARGNFCTINAQGIITDRRAGRISTERNAELCRLLSELKLNAKIVVTPVKEHRFVLLFQGERLSPELTDSDPQQVGLLPKEVEALSPQAVRTAEIANEFIAQAKKRLKNASLANMVLLRGFSRRPDMPSFHEIYKLKPAAIATYPMYRGLAGLVGMEILPTGGSITEEFKSLQHHYADHDFFFVHFKSTDSRGEDGDFEAKAHAIEEVDQALPDMLKLNPDVIIVTGDHSTPATLAMHSWHAVPLMLHSKWCRPDNVTQFSESTCINGGLGQLAAVEIMPLAMANALKLDKFGA